MLNRFYTLNFFREIARIFNPGGVVITEITLLHLQADAVNYTGSVYKTLRAVFPYVLVTPGATHCTHVATADPDSITFDVQTLSRRYRERQIA